MMIIVIDFGSQFNQLIVRRVREYKILCEIVSFNTSIKEIIKLKPNGIILSGGPSNIYKMNSKSLDPNILNLGIPILGICYGMHYVVNSFGGKIKKNLIREYGATFLHIKNKKKLFHNIKDKSTVWMSHEDSIKSLPAIFNIDAFTKNTKIAAISNTKKNIYGVQFHPEVAHTKEGKKIFFNFLIKICKCKQNWSFKSFVKNTIIEICKNVGKNHVVLALSGGIDSLLTAVIVEKAVGKKQLTCIFVNNGLLRKNEEKKFKKKFNQYLKCNIRYIIAKERFIKSLSEIFDPEKKRKIIGNLFINIFNEEAKKIKNAKYLAQGTLYPDVIESISLSKKGMSSTIKSHHNVGGLPKKMRLKLIEPLRFLFKDEVRILAKKMGLDNEIIWQHPFPGPGLAIRTIGKITSEKLFLLRKADSILQEEIKNSGYYKKLWQSFAIILPTKSVGIMGDKRTYEHIIAIRAVTSSDGMTADWAKLPHNLLGKISNRIVNEVSGINKVMYDISSKPPSTIEME